MAHAAHETSTDPAPSRVRKRAEGGDTMRERRCIVTGAIVPESRLLRFVAGPDGVVVADPSAKLPGRGLWVTASAAAIAQAAQRKLFARAAKAQVAAPADLPARAERALIARMTGDLGLARRSGALVLGFDNVLRGLEGKNPPGLLIEACDGAPDGKRKLFAAVRRSQRDCPVLALLTAAELGLALGRENVVHAAVQPGGLAERLKLDAQRLAGFRGAGNERDS
jgi:predicted RNA-binding protein YlxR (DUF448 family)